MGHVFKGSVYEYSSLQVYATRGWVLAEDHIHFTLGKQAHHLKQLTEGLEAYSCLVDQRLKQDASSQQSPSQQMTYVREFINTFHQYVQEEWDSSTGLPCLPLPLIDSQGTRVLLGAPQDPPTSCEWTAASHVSLDTDSSSDKRWFALERELVTANQGSAFVFRPNLQLLTSDTPNTQSPVVPVNEPLFVEIIMNNPLAVSLMISDVRLVFTFEPTSGHEATNSPILDFSCSEFTLAAGAQERVRLELNPQCIGKLFIKGVMYKLSLTPDMTSGSLPGSATTVTIEGQQVIEVKGPRLNNTSTEKCSVVYASDKRLEITVVPPMSRLSVTFHDLPQILSCGELCSRDAVITNIGPCPINRLGLAVSDPNHVYVEIEEVPLSSEHIIALSESEVVDSKITCRTEILKLKNGALNPGETIQAKLWLHAPMSPGAFDVELLFCYETPSSSGKSR